MRARLSICVAILAALLPGPGASASEPVLPAKILAYLHANMRGAELVRPDQFDPQPCVTMPPSPSVLEGDLAGNHRDDFAALLKLKTGRLTSREGKQEAQFVLMIFTDDGLGGYTAQQIVSFSDSLPIADDLELETAGKLHDIETNSDVTLTHPALSLTFCGKSSAAYYLQDGVLRTIPLFD